MNFQSATSVSNTEAVEVLWKATNLNLTAPFHGTFTLTAGSTLGMRVFMDAPNGSGLVQWVFNINNTTSNQFWAETIVLNPNINSVAIFNVPIACNAGDVITIQLASTANLLSSITITCIGSAADVLAAPASPISNFPVGGLFAVTVNSVVGNVQILGAPPPEMAWRLHCVTSFNAAAKCWLIGGGFTYGNMSQAGTGNEGYCALHGNLCTSNLSINSGTAGIGVTLQYDLVALPTIL